MVVHQILLESNDNGEKKMKKKNRANHTHMKEGEKIGWLSRACMHSDQPHSTERQGRPSRDRPHGRSGSGLHCDGGKPPRPLMFITLAKGWGPR